MSKKTFYLCSSNKTNINLKFIVMIEIIKGSEFDFQFQIGAYSVSIIDIIGYGDSTLKIVYIPRNEILYFGTYNIIGRKKTASMLIYYLNRLSNLSCMDRDKTPDKERRLLKIFLLMIGFNDFDFRD